MVKINYTTCMKCLEENGVPSMQFGSLGLNDTGFHDIECNAKHKTRVILQNQKYEILFEVGALAFLDGYNFESISSFTASLERFLEHSLKILWLSKYDNLTEFDKNWKEVENQSERQYGAFLFLYSTEFNEIKAIPHKWKEFRNKILHKGYIPNANETSEYGKFVYDYITALTHKFQQNKSESIQKLTFIELAKKTNSEIQGTTIYLSTMLSHSNNANYIMDFQSSLDQLKGRQLCWG